jgi:hypothetical protein
MELGLVQEMELGLVQEMVLGLVLDEVDLEPEAAIGNWAVVGC